MQRFIQSPGVLRFIQLGAFCSVLVFLTGVFQIDPLIGRWWDNDPDTLMLVGVGGMQAFILTRRQRLPPH